MRPTGRPPARFLWCAAIAAALVTLPCRADEFDTLRLKWVDMLTGGTSYNPSDAAFASAVTSITNTANTYWSSLNKSADRPHLWSDAARTNVSADINTNYSRLRSMALAYATTGSALKGNVALRNDILAGLDWMYANRYNERVRIYDNWWHFEIGSPTALVDIVALLYDEISPSQLSNYMGTVEKFTPNATTPAAGGSTGTFTGANRMSKIVVVTIRGLIVKDAAKLRGARDAFSNLFVYVTSGDGFYTDGSFVQHTRHPYTGSYGAVLLSDLSNILTLLNGPNALSAEGSTWKVIDPDLAHVYRWVYDSYEPLIYRGGMMAMTQGRAISRSGTSEHGTGHGIMLSILRISQFAPAPDRARMRAMLKYWGETDTSRSFAGTAPLPLKFDVQQLLADPTVESRGELLGNHVFANMGRVVHLAAGFGAGLAMSSSRTYTYESINGENLHGWYTGDGMLYLYNADLAHFSDSFWPTVNPRRLPGTTVDAGQTRANGSGQSTAPASNWVGGASVGRYGAAGMQLRGWSNTLRANKSWFMFDDEIVCLGSGITSTDNRTIETTIENRLLASSGANAFTVDGAAKPAGLGWSETMAGVRWAHLAGRVSGADIGYYFLVPTTVNALREARTGAWSEINTGGSSNPITRNYLTLWLDHGPSPADAAYGYVLLPGRTASQVDNYAANPPLVVLANTSSAHAVRETSLGVTAANFWNDGPATAGGISVDRRASVVVQDRFGVVDVAVSDPTHANTGSIVVEIATATRGIVSTDSGVSVVQLAPTMRLMVDVAGARGRTFRARLTTGESRPPAALSNLSTRAHVRGRDDAVYAGFVVRGTGSKQLLLRAVGPTLGNFGVSGSLANPRLTLVNQAGDIIAENDDWGAATNRDQVVATSAAAGAFALVSGSRDAALLASVPAGQYSAVVRSADPPTAGIVLVEIYDPNPAGEPRLVNLSSRAFAGTAAQTAIVGFALSGDAPRQVLVRAAGPALAPFQVADALADPQLRLTQPDGFVLVQNDNWGGSPVAPDIVRTAANVGAFAFAPGSKDSAVLLWLNPGTYTALAADSANAVGSTLVEVYTVP